MIPPDWTTLSLTERAVASEKQTMFIKGCYAHAAKLLGAGNVRQIEPYPDLLGYGHDLSDEARRDIERIKR